MCIRDRCNFNYWMMAPGYTPENRKDNPGEGWASPVVQVNAWDLIPNYEEMDESKLEAGQIVNKLNAETSKAYLWDQTCLLYTSRCV